MLLPLKFYKLNYYDLVILPPLALLAGLGWRQLQTVIGPSRAAVAAVLALVLAAVDAACVRAGLCHPGRRPRRCRRWRCARSLAPPDEPIVAVHGSNFDLLYYCDHPGWAVPVDDPQFAAPRSRRRARQGAHSLVIANLASLDAQPVAKACLAQMPIETEGEDYRVYRLKD